MMNEYKENAGRERNAEAAVYKDSRYTLGQHDGRAYLIAGEKRFTLSCHPFEPCLYITGDGGDRTAVHNAFDPFVVLECFSGTGSVTSITGMKYDARDFCRMVEYAAGRGNINIDDAEKVFGDSAKGDRRFEKKPGEKPDKGAEPARPEGFAVIEEDPFYDTLEQYPDCVIDYCLVKSEASYNGVDSHFGAMIAGALHMIAEDWELDFATGKTGATKIPTEEFFSSEKGSGEKLNYRSVFLYPPYPIWYTGKDFERLNGALFPNGIGALEIYRWTTNWSDYFDDGREWWGTLCCTVYDRALDRFAVIMASATD